MFIERYHFWATPSRVVFSLLVGGTGCTPNVRVPIGWFIVFSDGILGDFCSPIFIPTKYTGLIYKKFSIGGQRWDVGYIPAYPLICIKVYRQWFGNTDSLSPVPWPQRATEWWTGYTKWSRFCPKRWAMGFPNSPPQKMLFFSGFFLSNLLEGLFGGIHMFEARLFRFGSC